MNSYRARKETVSRDQFAKLWVSVESERWADQYAEEVNVTEILVHALRHRFFLEQLTEFLRATPDGVFTNIGAGFTNYPYLLPDGIPCCELEAIRYLYGTLGTIQHIGDIVASTS